MQAILDLSNSGQQTAGGVFPDYEIPVHVYILKDEFGNEPNAEGWTIDIFANNLELANELFTNGMSFYICQVDDIVNTEWFNMSLGGSLPISTVADYSYDENALNIYIGNSVSGAAAFWDYSVSAMAVGGGIPPITLAHELGHGFGLEHTFRYTVWKPIPELGVDDPCIRLFPDNTCTSSCLADCFTGLCQPNEDISLGNCTGDFISDTGVDPSFYDTGGGGLPTNFCSPNEIPCTLIIDGIEEEFYIPYGNIMSYIINPVRDHFTSKQLERMLQVLEIGSQQHLIDGNVPECGNYTFNTDIYFPDQARVAAVKKDEFGEYYFPPFPDVRMKLINSDDDLSCIRVSDEVGYYNPLGGSCDDIMPDYLANVNIEAGRCVDNCPQLDVKNGVSVFDMRDIIRAILDIEALKKPYENIAADVNYSGTVTISDLIEIRKLILGYIQEFEDVPSWRFLPVYALDAQWAFQADFETDPFTAVWNINGEQRAYMSDGTNKSYLDKINLNLLNADATQEDTWSFRGIKSGDVTFNADIDPGFVPEYPGFSLTGGAHNCINPGEKFTVLFKTAGSNWSALEAYQMGLIISPHVASITGVNAGVLPGFTLDNFNVDNFKLGELRTLWYNEKTVPENLSADEVLFKLHLTANTSVCDISDVFAFSDSLLVNQVYSSHGNSRSLDITLEVVSEGRQHSLKSIYPNPSSNQFSFEFDLDAPETVTITLMDQNGNIQQETGQFIQGEHTFLINDTGTLQPGVITYMIYLGTEANTGNLIKM